MNTMASHKRAADSDLPYPVLKKIKRQVWYNSCNDITAIENEMPITSSLISPIVVLKGHESDILSVEFHCTGQYLASAGFDKKILIWNVYGQCECSVMSGHSNGITELHFNADGTLIYTSSLDKTLGVWDPSVQKRISVLEHPSCINTMGRARGTSTLICSGSNDCTIRIWDLRTKRICHTFDDNYPVTAVTFNGTDEQVITGSVDKDIKVWDLRNNALLYEMQGHTESVSGLSVSPNESYLLSNSMDNCLRIWDINTSRNGERCVKIFRGHQHNKRNLQRCAWSPDGRKVSTGSSDKFHYIWDSQSQQILYTLPGHTHSVNDVDFHPKEPIVCSASSDQCIRLGEIDP